MRRRTSSKKRRLLRKLLCSSSSLLQLTFKTITIVVRISIEYILFEAMFWFVTLGGLASLFIALGMPQNIASTLAIAIALGLLILALYIFCKFSQTTKPTKNKRAGEIKLASKISQTFAEQKSTEWHEYQDWLHDILLARQQLLDAKHPRWKVKLITYKRLSIFCIVVSVSKVKQIVASMRRSL